MVDELTPLATTVYINSIDVTDYVLNWSITEQKTGIKKCNIIFRKELIDDVISIVGNELVEIYRGPDPTTSATYLRKFYGNIVKISEDLSGYDVFCNDELYKATGNTLVKVYDSSDPDDDFSGDFNSIIIDMISNVPLTIDSGNVDYNGITIPQIVCDNVVIYDKVITLLKVPMFDIYQNSVDTEIYIKNPNDYPTYSTNFTSSTNIITPPNYDNNVYQIVNEVEIQGIRASAYKTETFTAVAAQTVYTLAKKPIDTYVECTVAGVKRIGSVEGSQTADPDFIINTNLGTLTFINNIPTVGQSVVVNYTSKELTSVMVNDEDSITAYGKRRLVLDLPDVKTVNDAIIRGKAIINESKDGFISFKVGVINANDLTCRYKVNVIDQIKNKTFENLEVQSIITRWPNIKDEITVGKSMYTYENLITSVEERVKKLERLRQEGTLLNVTKINDIKYYFFIDDIEIWRDDTSVVFKHFILDTDVLDDTAVPLGDYQENNGTVGESE